MSSICIFGDSTTWGAFDIEKGGWVQRLRTFIELSMEELTEIYNCGVSGDNTENLLMRFNNEAKSRKADKIIFAIGINDSSYIDSKNHLMVPIKKFRENLELLIKQARGFTNDITFVGLTPVDDSKTKPWIENIFYNNENILKYNAIIESVAKENKLEFISVYNLLTKDDLYDGLHPNSSGHQKIFETIKNKLLL